MTQLVEHFGLPETTSPLNARYNIAPSQSIAVVRMELPDRVRRLSLLKWGLVPSWAKDATLSAKMINARSETVAEKPAFRSPLRRHRCLILADGYFEWQKVGSHKQPYYIRLRDHGPFAFAGLWDSWKRQNPDEPPLESCTIITTPANEISQPIHDRMPAILREHEYELWLNPDVQESETVLPMLQPLDSSLMVAERVSTFVNQVRNDGPRCIEVQRPLF
jgi:putative SOS response-associated peptidase YedK